LKIALTIAGSDPSGGAGLQADLKTFQQHGVYGASVVTLLTVQNTQRVSGIEILRPEFVRAQLEAVLADIPPHAAKTGALGTGELIEMVADAARQFTFPLVVDPVMISKHGHPLIDRAAIEALRVSLLPRAFLITPNVHEAAELSGISTGARASLREMAEALADLGAKNVLVKSDSQSADAKDLLWHEGQIEEFFSPRIESRCLHGTGCVLSAAITARLALGEALPLAVAKAKRFVTAAIQSGPNLGQGISPVNFLTPPD
jgi:hydroxymethylpyrimidine/phosphomethylpyrimidine kinase